MREEGGERGAGEEHQKLKDGENEGMGCVKKEENLIKIDVALISAFVLAIVLGIRERLAQPLIALRRLDQRLRQLLDAAPAIAAGARDRSCMIHSCSAAFQPHVSTCETSNAAHAGKEDTQNACIIIRSVATWALACRH